MDSSFGDLDLLDQLLEEEGIAPQPAARFPRRPEQERCVLSYQQQRLWFLYELEPESAAFNVSGAVALRGRLDRAALQASLNAVVQRHEALRTRFVVVDGTPWQQITAHGDVPLAVDDLSQLSQTSGESLQAAIREQIEAETAQPFDLRQGPLIRARLLICGAQEHALIVTIHHIVCDGWSIGIFLNELARCYQAFARGLGPALEPLPVQYGDYAHWQRTHRGNDHHEAQLAYWQRQLADLPTLWLPWARPRHEHAEPMVGGSVARTVATTTATRLRHLVKEHDATLAMGMMAAFQTLLYRYARQHDFAIGLASSNRDVPEIEGLIGFFVNMLVIRADLHGAPSFAEVIGRVRETMLAAMAHGDVPFEMLVDRLSPERHLNRHPLFQVSFVFQNLPARDFQLPDLVLARLGEDRTARFDLEIFITDSDEGLRVNWVYDAHLFDHEIIEAMADAYECLLDEVTARPASSIDAARLVPPARSAAMIQAREQARQVFPVDQGLPQIFSQTAARFPQRTGLIEGRRKWRYHELEAAANRMAHHLVAQGVTPGAFVGLYRQRSADMVLSILAILKAGAAYVPIDPMYPADRVRFILADSQVSWVIADAALQAQLQPDTANYQVLTLAEADWRDYPDSAPDVAGDPDAIAYIIYTSGSTGRPKGCLITHRNVVRLMRATEAWFGFDETDVWTLFHSYAFDFSVWEMWGAWFYGGRLIVIPYELSRDTEAFYDLVCTQRVTVLNQTPSAFKSLIQVDQRSERDGELALRHVIFGGEALDLDSLTPWLERHGDAFPRLINMYGITETTVHVTYRPITYLDVIRKRGSVIGEPIPDLSIHILDASGNPVPPGAIGEIHVGGAGVSRGYLNREELTRERFIANSYALPDASPDTWDARWYRSGDLGYWCNERDIEYRGRADQQVKIRGFRIETGEIRARIQDVAAVQDSLVVLDANSGDSRLLAYVVPDHAYLSARERQRRLAEQQVGEWQQTFDITYAQANPTGIEEFNTAGWLQSYTGEQIPDHEMQEWREDTLAAIRVLQPRRILEVGCGTGMLLLALAPQAAEYVGLDFSATTIRQLGEIVTRRSLDHVELHRKTAEDLQFLGGRQFDAIIINSVIQYFPDSDYLIQVLRQCAALLADDGAIFVGDVRNLALLEAYHASVAWQRVSRETIRSVVAEHVRLGMMHEEELLLDPAFFAALPAQLPEIRTVVLSAKPGVHANELNKYRYDVFLCRSERAAEGVARLRREPAPAVLAALRQDAAIIEWLHGERPGTRVADVNLDRALAGQDAELSPLRSTGKPRYNQPAVAQALRKLPAELRAHLEQFLPGYMVPAHIVVMDAFPLTVNGKVNLDALPRPVTERASAQERFTPAQPGVETDLAALWCEVLNLERVSRDDNFFALGGHSLLATQLIARINQRFATNLPLRKVFEQPTLAGFARLLTPAESELPKQQAEPIPSVARTGPLPLSFAQQRLWFLEQVNPEGATYNTYQVIQVHGPLDLVSLQRALDHIIERHEILRTSIASVHGDIGDEPHQIIHSEARCRILHHEGSYTADGNPTDLLQQSILEEVGKPFALEHAPLLRAVVWSHGSSRHTVALVAHHIIIDGWSLGVLIRELNECYRALRRNAQPALPPLPIQYADYASWQQQWIRGEAAVEQRDYWLRELAQPPVECTLPHDSRPDIPEAQDSTAGAILTRRLGRRHSAELSALCARHQVTPFMVLLSALYTLLHRVTGKDDLVVGSPIAQRNRRELEPLIGFFVNTLALRAKPRAAQSFAELLAAVRHTVLGAYGHQNYPFERLVEELLTGRNGMQNPLFQIMLVVQNQPMDALDWDGLPCTTLELPATAAKFDLTLFAGENADRELVITAEYRTAAYREHTIGAYLDAFQRILTQAVADPEMPLTAIPLALARVDASVPAAPEHLLVALFAQTVERHANAIAVEYQGHGLTYGQLDSDSDRIAHALVAAGICPEQPVAVLMEPRLEVIPILLGIWKAGAVYLPLEPRNPARRLTAILDDARPGLLITDGSSGTLAPDAGGVPVWTLQHLAERMLAPDPAPFVSPIHPEQLAYIIYTSGSTGRPKGVMVEHRGMANLALTELRHYGTRHGDRVLLAANLTFDASVSEIINVLASGATLVMMPREQMIPDDALVAALRKLAISWWTIRPSFLSLLHDRELPGLRTLILAGERLEPEVARPWFVPGRKIFNAYGPTETTVCASCDLLEPGEQQPAIGRPLDQVRMYVLDPWQNPLPDGVSGEIYIGGIGVSRGYLGQPALTAERFLPDPFSGLAGARMYRTGDLGKRLPDGKLLCLGRVDFQIKLRGYRIDPGEIEARLRQVEGIQDAVVTCLRNAETGDSLIGHVVTELTADEAEQRVYPYLREHLPEYMVPQHIVTLRELPLNANGKLDRHALPMPDATRLAAGTAGRGHGLGTPRSTLEWQLCLLFERVLERAPVGVEQSFFELGGHSFLAIRLVSEIARELGKKISVNNIFIHPTVRALSAVLEQGDGLAAQSGLVPLRKRGELAPLFLVHQAGGYVYSYFPLTRHIARERPIYGLQPPGLDGQGEPLTSIPALAQHYRQQIRAVQPHGPYHLAGHSLGGIIAHEMAQQWGREGERVAYLGLIDAHMPGDTGDELAPRGAFQFLIEQIEGVFGQRLEIALEPGSDPDIWIAQTARAIQRAGIADELVAQRYVSGLYRVFLANVEAYRTYTAAPRACEAYVYQTRAVAEILAARPELSWERWLENQVHTCMIPGEHLDLLQEPHVTALGRLMNDHLAGSMAVGMDEYAQST